MEALKIVLLTVVGAVLYGIAHDMVTAHVCPEYFTIGHPRVIDSHSPVHLALVWGVLATWWVGVAGGLLLAAGARLGAPPRRRAAELARPLAGYLLVLGGLALVAGLVGRRVAGAGGVVLLPPLADRVPPERHVAFLADLWAHLASYGFGAVLLVVLAVRTWCGRARERRGAGRPAAG